MPGTSAQPRPNLYAQKRRQSGDRVSRSRYGLHPAQMRRLPPALIFTMLCACSFTNSSLSPSSTSTSSAPTSGVVESTRQSIDRNVASIENGLGDAAVVEKTVIGLATLPLKFVGYYDASDDLIKLDVTYRGTSGMGRKDTFYYAGGKVIRVLQSPAATGVDRVIYSENMSIVDVRDNGVSLRGDDAIRDNEAVWAIGDADYFAQLMTRPGSTVHAVPILHE